MNKADYIMEKLSSVKEGSISKAAYVMQKHAAIKLMVSEKLWNHWPKGAVHRVGGEEISTKQRLKMIADTMGSGSLQHNLEKVVLKRNLEKEMHMLEVKQI